MEPALIFIIFMSTAILGITGYSIYAAFGPGSKSLKDPFEEHED
jgi:PsbN protein